MAETFEVVQEVTVDVSKSIPAPTVFCKQADNVVRVLRVTIQDNKEDYPIPAGFAARLRGTKADGTRIYLDARSAAGNVAEFILTQNALAAYGKATCEVELSNSAGDVVKSCNLVLNVQKAAMDDSAVESTDEFQSLGAAVAGAQAAQKAAAKSAEAAKKSADDAKAVQDSLPADYTKMSSKVDALNTKMELAYPDNTGVSDATWGAKQIIDTLCPPIEESGNPVQCYPVAGYPLGCKVSWEPVQEGSGDPSPDNIRAIKGRESVTVTRCGENLSNAEGGSFDIFNTYYYDHRLNISILPNKQYTISFIGKSSLANWFPEICIGDANAVKAAIAVGESYNDTNEHAVSITFNIPDWIKSGIYGFRLWARLVRYNGPVTCTYSVSNIMLTVGSVSSSYKGYTGQTTTLTLPETVYGGEVDAVTGEGNMCNPYINR